MTSAPSLARGDSTLAEAEQIEEQRQDALDGVDFEVRKAYLELSEAQSRSRRSRKGEKAGKAWVGRSRRTSRSDCRLARLSDALLQSFKMRTFALQAVFDLNVSAAALRRDGSERPSAPNSPVNFAGGEAIGGAERTGGAERLTGSVDRRVRQDH